MTLALTTPPGIDDPRALAEIDIAIPVHNEQATLATEPSDASGTLMFDVARRRWSEDMMRAVDLPRSLLPDVGESSQILGRVTRDAAALTGLGEGTPVVGGGADNACGAAGVGAISPGDAVSSWGTSGTVLTPTAQPLVDPQLRAHTFCHVAPPSVER